MKAFGEELYTNYKYSTEMAQWMKAERFAYCEQPAKKDTKKRHFIARLLLSILG